MKKALLIGINYIGKNSELHGCIKDVTNMYDILINDLEYQPKNIVMMTDTSMKPTYKNILKEIETFTTGVKSGDMLFFQYSGHGSNTYDRNTDEADGMDECIIPLDYENNVITDDQLRQILVNKIPVGAKLFAVMDCCNSGTVFDLRYRLKLKGETTRYKVARSSYSSNMAYALDVLKYGRTRTQIVMSTVVEEVESCSETVSNSIIMLSGCRDTELSSDINSGNILGGALTLSLLDVLKRYKYKINYNDMLMQVQLTVKNTYRSDQTPQLTLGQKVNIMSNIEF